MSTLSVEALREQAARWVVRLNEGELSEGDRQEFYRWLLRDELHAREYRAHVAAMALASELPADMPLEIDAEPHSNVIPLTTAPVSPYASPLPTSFPIFRHRRRFLGIAAAAGLVLAVTAGWLVFNAVPATQQAHATQTGETQTVTFEDGSVAYLNTRTRLQWIGNKDQRKVALLSGEALFDVVHDAARPFSVIVDKSEIRVLGTRFNVYRKKNDEVVVTVVEGRVEVRQQIDQGIDQGIDNRAAADASPAWARRLGAGEQIAYSSIGLTRDVQTVNTANTVKWREGVLELVDEPLPNVLDELTRYTDQRIVIKDPQLAQLRLGGALSTRDVRAALARIEKLAPIAVTESGNMFTLDHREAREERN